MRSNDDGIMTNFYEDSSDRLYFELRDGPTDSVDKSQEINPDQLYYFSTTKLAGALSCIIYDDEARTNIVDTILVNGTDRNYQYVNAFFSRNKYTNTSTGYAQNLDIGRTFPVAGGRNIPNYHNSQFITHS